MPPSTRAYDRSKGEERNMKSNEKFYSSHFPLFRSKRKKQEGVLFTIPMIISLAVLATIIFCCVFATVISPYSPTSRTLQARSRSLRWRTCSAATRSGATC